MVNEIEIIMDKIFNLDKKSNERIYPEDEI
jgi:hypothetical protein